MQNCVEQYSDVSNVPVMKLLEYCDPFQYNCWLIPGGPITPKEVYDYARDNPSIEENTKTGNLTREDHIAKIAYFVINDAVKPIQIDVGVPGLCNIGWFITDGNHRFYAAVLNKKAFIPAEVSGSLDYAESLGLISGF